MVKVELYITFIYSCWIVLTVSFFTLIDQVYNIKVVSIVKFNFLKKIFRKKRFQECMALSVISGRI